jgi:hypothetical protein
MKHVEMSLPRLVITSHGTHFYNAYLTNVILRMFHLPETKEQLLIIKTLNIGSNNIYKVIYVVRSIQVRSNDSQDKTQLVLWIFILFKVTR